MSAVTYKKLIKSDGEPTELERTIASHFTDLASSEELKNQINELYFVGAQVCHLTYSINSLAHFQKLEHGNKSCIIIWVPFPQLRDFQKCHAKLVRELEKKFSGSHVVILAKVGG
jgi:small subunit ribosomal protein S7e